MAEWSGLLDWQSGLPGSKSCSGHSLDLILVVPISNPWQHLKIANWLPLAQLGFIILLGSI